MGRLEDILKKEEKETEAELEPKVILHVASKGKLLGALYAGDVSYFKLVNIRKGQDASTASPSFWAGNGTRGTGWVQ